MQFQREPIIPPAADLSFVKATLRIEHPHDDGALDGLIAAVTDQLCRRGGLALRNEAITASWESWTDCGDLSLPIAPLGQDQVTGLAITLGGSSIKSKVDVTVGNRPLIRLKGDHGLSADQLSEPVVITYTAGFGADIADVPVPYQTAIAHQVSYIFDAEDQPPRSRRDAPLFAALVGSFSRVGITS